MDTEEGVSPRQIAQQLDRGDEPNIRTALTAMKSAASQNLYPARPRSTGA
jgi:hypothetical protein